ncbi:MAG: TldD/PmbA family protein [Gammaproteobacteria bacterium]
MQSSTAAIRDRLTRLLPAGARWSLRHVQEQGQFIAYRQDVLQPLFNGETQGVFLQVAHNGGLGYCASSDTSNAGLENLARQALRWASTSSQHALFNAELWQPPEHSADYENTPAEPWDAISLNDRLELVGDACRRLKQHENIVDWSAYVGHRIVESTLLSSAGGEIQQRFHFITPGLSATANKGSTTEKRTGGGVNEGRQGGVEQLRYLGFSTDSERIAREAVELLDAPQCPEGEMDLILMPGQMVLQIHESIGHPLELDRILGDERNYAGTSFVTQDMFGSYHYGSALLNISFDPGIPQEIASYGFDDDGSPAEKTYLIRDGILERPLGGALSQARTGLDGVANARACAWNRPPIDRMANLNLEPGKSSLEQLVASVERGVLMDSNRSWSIDDSRNKFQFGCEYGRLIENGELRGLVRNPNYRGISASFWRSLSGVGNAETLRVGGVTNCGKGEPNQSIYVGHASPPCLFRQVSVFGGSGG